MKKLVSILLIMSLFVGCMGSIHVKADEDDDGIIYDMDDIKAWDGNGVEFVGDSFISVQGIVSYKREHTMNTTGHRYSTDRIIVSATPLTYTENIVDRGTKHGQYHSLDGLTRYAELDVKTKPGEPHPVTHKFTTTYTFSNSPDDPYNLSAIGEKLGAEVKDGYMTLYMSHVFVVKSDNIRELNDAMHVNYIVAETTDWLNGQYKCYNDFWKKISWSTSSVPAMKECVNIKLRVPYTVPVPVYAYIYDVDNPRKSAVAAMGRVGSLIRGTSDTTSISFSGIGGVSVVDGDYVINGTTYRCKYDYEYCTAV